MTANINILPYPKELKLNSEKFLINSHTALILESSTGNSLLFSGKLLLEEIEKMSGLKLELNKVLPKENYIFLTMDESLKSEGYKISISHKGIKICGADVSGVLYGVSTLRQIIRQLGLCIDGMDINDYPSLQNRGYYLDQTRGRVSTLEQLKAVVDMLCFYKKNQLQLYIEHSFLFKNLSEMWRDDTPLTAEDIIELDAYCIQRGVELVPSMASFGHLYKLMRTKDYGYLCELDTSNPAPFSFIDRMRHHTIDISNPESFELICSLMDEYMALFTSKHFNICADETFDLGKGKGKKLADEIGSSVMYVKFVKKLCEYLISKGRRPMFWGDIIVKTPELVNELPKEVICLNWGYLPNQNEYDSKVLSEAGATQYLCPGVCGWNQWVNYTKNSYENIKTMASHGYKYNAIGLLNTDWGDFGHINNPIFSRIGVIYGAIFSWGMGDDTLSDTRYSYEELNKKISVIEYGDKTEKFVDIVENISDYQIFHWEKAVRYHDLVLGLDKSIKSEEFFDEKSLLKVNSVNKILEDKLKQLYASAINISSDSKHVLKHYVNSTEAIILWNKIGLFQYFKDEVYGVSKENRITIGEEVKCLDGKALAKELECWFYEFKKLWRETSKESELYRIQEVVLWYGDLLRK